MKQKALAALLTTYLAFSVQQAQAENLLQVYQQAKGYDAQFKALESNYLATLEQKPQALAALKPQISVSGSATQSRQHSAYDASISVAEATGNAFNAQYSLGLSKSLYNKSLNAQVDLADSIIIQAGAQLEAERQNLIIRVAQAYFNFLLSQDNLEFARTEKAAISRQLEQTRAYFEAGRSAITDVKEAESRFDLSVAQELNAVNQLNLAREQLRVLTGGFYQTLNAPAADMVLALPKPGDIEYWVKTAKANNKQLMAAKEAIKTAQTQIDAARANKKPVVNLIARQTGSTTENEVNALDPQNYGASVGVEVNMPLYTGGAISSRIREAQHSLRQAQQQYEFQDRTTEQQVRNAFLTVESSISQAKANQRALASAETAAEATQAGFEVGTRTAVDVLTALRNVFSARRDYASSRYDYLNNTLLLRQAAGILSEQDIVNMNRFMTATAKQSTAQAAPKTSASQADVAATGEQDNGYQYYNKPAQPQAAPAKPAPQVAPRVQKPAAPQQQGGGQQQYFIIPKDIGE